MKKYSEMSYKEQIAAINRGEVSTLEQLRWSTKIHRRNTRILWITIATQVMGYGYLIIKYIVAGFFTT